VSTSPSNNSQRSSTLPKSHRAKSVFRGSKDPYFPRNQTNAASLPISDDWGFRLQVVSESTEIHTEMFKKAVQGLVKICFPQNVLDELGIHVVQQHMREQNAPKGNIEKMSEIFRSEMVHRLVWMLAEHLNDTSKVEAVVKSVTAASAALHSHNIGPDILNNVITSLQRLRERVPGNSTEALANDTVLTDFIPDTINGGSSVAMSVETSHENEIASSCVSDLSERGVESHVDALEMQNKSKAEKDSITLLKHTANHRGASGGKEKAVGYTAQPAREGKENKISASWRWNVKRSDVSVDNIQLYFHRTVDLFAYHALPIAKGTLGHDANRKAVRDEIESLWVSATDKEYGKWVESFHKLQGGDLDMIDRVETTPDPAPEGVAETTPTPITFQKEQARITVEHPDTRNRTAEDRQTLDNGTDVRREVGPASILSAEVPRPESQKRSRAKVPSSIPSQCSKKIQSATTDSNIERYGSTPKWLRTPIVDLLWGKAGFEFEKGLEVVRVIMKELNLRVSFGVIMLPPLCV
jgi:hypothetical protein